MIPDNEEDNGQKIYSLLRSNRSKYNKDIIVLIDGDRTLFPDDASNIFNAYANIDRMEIKREFEKYGYTYNGFFSMVSIYNRLSSKDYLECSKKAAEKIVVYPGVIQFIKIIKEKANVCIVTSGIRAVWETFLKNNGMGDIELFAGTDLYEDNYLIGRNEKGLIARYFKNCGKKVIAIGDSDVDTLMLKAANIAIVVVNHKNNNDLINNVISHPCLYQISYTDFKHGDIKEIAYDSIHTIIDDSQM